MADTENRRAWIAWQLRTVAGTTEASLLLDWGRGGVKDRQRRSWGRDAIAANLTAGLDREGVEPEGDDDDGDGDTRPAQAQSPVADIDRDGDSPMPDDQPNEQDAGTTNPEPDPGDSPGPEPMGNPENSRAQQNDNTPTASPVPPAPPAPPGPPVLHAAASAPRRSQRAGSAPVSTTALERLPTRDDLARMARDLARIAMPALYPSPPPAFHESPRPPTVEHLINRKGDEADDLQLSQLPVDREGNTANQNGDDNNENGDGENIEGGGITLRSKDSAKHGKRDEDMEEEEVNEDDYYDLDDDEDSHWLGQFVREDLSMVPEESRPSVARNKEGWPTTTLGDIGRWSVVETAIGKGGYSTAMLWLRTRDGKIVDRVAVKTCFVEHSAWNKWTNWHGDPKDVSTRKHIEIHIMETLRDRPGHTKVMTSRAAHTQDDSLYYRIYMKYCPHGNLNTLITNQENHKLGNEPIPEPFLWSVFNDLVEAFLLLQSGDATLDAKQTGWGSIVHRDLKPGNVFLDTRESSPLFPAYPKARVGDFGCSIITSDEDPNNPLAYNDAKATPGWNPPEQLRHINKTLLSMLDEPNEGRPKIKLGEKNNVWGIGAIIIRLMNQDVASYKRDPELKTMFKTARPDEPVIPSADATNFYTPQLRKLATSCVRYFPEERASPVSLREQTQRHTMPDTAGDMARGMRTSSADVTGTQDELWYLDDEYKIGMAVPT